jgi:hypothetical protein
MDFERIEGTPLTLPERDGRFWAGSGPLSLGRSRESFVANLSLVPSLRVPYDLIAPSKRLTRPCLYTQRLPRAGSRRVRPPRSPRLLKVGLEQPMGPVRGGVLPGRHATPTRADNARLDGCEARTRRQHAGVVSRARPLPANTHVEHHVGRHRQRNSCSPSGRLEFRRRV